MNTRSDWSATFINLCVLVVSVSFYATVFMFLAASIDKQTGAWSAMGWRESVAYGAAWSMVVALRRGGK